MQYLLPWHYDCYQGILDYAKQHQWICRCDPFLIALDEQKQNTPSRSDATAPEAIHGVVGRINATLAEITERLSIPVVNLSSSILDRPMPGVCGDTAAAARLAAQHLLDNGHQHFAIVDYRDHPCEQMRTGFSQLVRARNGKLATPFHFQQVPLEASRSAAIDERRRLIRWLESLPKPVAIYVRQPLMARFVAQTCSEIGISIPSDASILVAADSMVLTGVEPQISAIEYDFRSLGYKAAAVLHRLMQGQPVPASQQPVAPKQLIVRESSDTLVVQDQLVCTALTFIANNCHRTLQVDDVANAVNTSRRTLYRRFDQVLGRSVRDEIARRRNQHIKKLLLQSQQPLAEIAEQCGFSSASHFARYFRKEVGQTPTRFRKNYAGNLAESSASMRSSAPKHNAAQSG